MTDILAGGSENLFYLAYGMPQSRTSRKAEIESSTNKATLSIPEITKGVYLYRYSTKNKNGEVNYTGKLIKK